MWLVSLGALCNCVAGLELPAPPDVSERARRYDTPTAEFTSQNAADFIQGFLDDRARLQQVDDFGEVIRAIVRLDSEVTVNSDGNSTSVEIQGAPIQTDALVEVTGDCPGFSGESIAKDAFSFSLVIERSELIPVIWGQIFDCRFERIVSGESLRVRFAADLTAYLPNLVSPDDRPLVLYALYDITDLSVSSLAVPPWKGDFRFVDSSLEILVESAAHGTVVLFQKQGLSEIGVRAANGEWSCFTQERRCDSLQLPAFSY